MKKKILAVACVLSLLAVVEGCKKKEEQPAPQPSMQQGMQQLPPGHTTNPGVQEGGIMVPRGATTLSLPDSVKGKWKSVVLIVEDKASKKTSELTVSLNSDVKIPNSNLKLSVGEFIPDFKMQELTITSMSNDPNNPAVGVKVFENDKEIFKGWLYSKFPNIHPFNHPKYGITLKEGLKKG
jgi:hypothetical protein